MQLPESQHLVRTTQHALDDLNEFAAHHLRLKLTNDTEASTAQGIDNTPVTGSIVDDAPDIALTVRVVAQEDLATPRSELRADTTQLDIFYPPSQVPIPSSSNPPLSVFIAEELQRLYSEEKATIAHILSGGTAGRDSESISRRLRRSMKYADTYHLSFSLFTPGSAPSSWDIQAAVQEYLSPLLHAFGPISNFTIDTQVQLYATFSPMAPPPVYDETESAWTLKKEDLSAFINAAEWPLNPSIGNGPTLNFILYVPDPSQSPMVVKENRASSWIVPQWGGVFLLNPPLEQAGKSGSQTNPAHITQESLRPAFMTFSHQLLTLLGTPTTPASLPLRLQSLIRVRAATLLLSASSTMGSLARLTESLASIPIPATVASSVSTTLAQLSATCSHLREGRFGAALASARIAETEAERSFFEKSMVGQVYFPDEHKVAVYLPLLGPIGVPLLVSLMKELKRLVAGWKAQRRSTA
jgi:phosphatidylinositol glycan class S